MRSQSPALPSRYVFFLLAALAVLMAAIDSTIVAVALPQLTEEVAKRTSTDKLTGLWNRQYFNERFREECERLVRSKETGTVAIIGLDNFSALARTMPAEEVNNLFSMVGQTVRQVIRQTDWAVRWDNNEKYNAGIDARFLNNRLSLTADGFYDHRYNLLTNISSSVPLLGRLITATAPMWNSY